MTAKQLFETIISEPKWYAPLKISPQNASQMKRRFEKNRLEFETMQRIFNYYGYYFKDDWTKIF